MKKFDFQQNKSKRFKNKKAFKNSINLTFSNEKSKNYTSK